MRALLDVNVLIALLDVDHVHHTASHAWLEANIDAGWASCPLTQNGCIRIMSQPSYPGTLSAAAVAHRLAVATRTPWHRFWPDGLSLLADDVLDWTTILSARQVTDVYLLALAVANEGCFVTFDRSVPIRAVPNARPEHLVLLYG